MWFANPYAFLLLLLLIPLTYRYMRQRPAVRIPSGEVLQRLSPSIWIRFRHLLFILRCCTIFFVAIALARPQTGHTQREKKTDGLDIMLVLDTSGSMQALDFVLDGKRYDRLSVV